MSALLLTWSRSTDDTAVDVVYTVLEKVLSEESQHNVSLIKFQD